MTAPDRATTERNIALLRERLLALARRRVPDAAAEDLVQEALAIICARGLEARIAAERPIGPVESVSGRDPGTEGGAGGLEGTLPPLAWCFQVLRNVIGNFYQRRTTRERWNAPGNEVDGPGGPTPLEMLEERDAVERIERAVRRLGHERPECGRYLRGILAGEEPSAIAGREGLDPSVFYRRLYRCRARLREMLEREEGIRT